MAKKKVNIEEEIQADVMAEQKTKKLSAEEIEQKKKSLLEKAAKLKEKLLEEAPKTEELK